MKLEAVPSDRPDAKDDVARLASSHAGATLGVDLWSQVHDEIQKQLAVLENEVCRIVPEVRVKIGRTRGERFLLFTYRTFSLPESVIDPVVAGMTFSPANDDVFVEAEVSGEQTGDLLSAIPGMRIALTQDGLAKVGGVLGQQLCQSARVIAAALRDSSRRAN